jgi:hypothetical protein
VVVRAQRVLEEGDVVLGGVEGPELGLGYPLVVVEDGDLDGGHGGDVTGFWIVEKFADSSLNK